MVRLKHAIVIASPFTAKILAADAQNLLPCCRLAASAQTILCGPASMLECWKPKDGIKCSH